MCDDAFKKPFVPVVVGPTASGKSRVAQALAELLGFAVLSADSMQVYKGMDIGTNKVPQAQRTVDYYGLDIADPAKPYSVACFQAYGREIVDRLFEKGSGCVVCGGTGLYIKALLDDMTFPAGGQVGNSIRDTYNQLVEEHGSAYVWSMLNEIDPDSATQIAPSDAKRIVRAFEMHHEGVSYANQKAAFSSVGAYYPAFYIGLRVDPAILRIRIDERVEHMFDDGLVDETAKLRDAGVLVGMTSKKAIGYAQVADYLAGSITLEQAKESIKIATHQYARRQRTWFNKDKRIMWLDANDASDEAMDERARQALKAYLLSAMKTGVATSSHVCTKDIT